LTKPFRPADETIFPINEDALKPRPLIKKPDQQRGSIMWSLIISLIYKQSCKKYLADLARHQHGWI
jgi:hypothetical protein